MEKNNGMTYKQFQYIEYLISDQFEIRTEGDMKKFWKLYKDETGKNREYLTKSDASELIKKLTSDYEWMTQMSQKLDSKSKSSNTVRIHNTVTKSYYQIRQRSTSAGKKGTIIGKWSSKQKK